TTAIGGATILDICSRGVITTAVGAMVAAIALAMTHCGLIFAGLTATTGTTTGGGIATTGTDAIAMIGTVGVGMAAGVVATGMADREIVTAGQGIGIAIGTDAQVIVTEVLARSDAPDVTWLRRSMICDAILVEKFAPGI